MKDKFSVFLTILLVIVIGVRFSTFIVKESQQAMILQFGRPVGDPITQAGLKFKLPYQNVRYLESRILTWDGTPEEFPTKDKKLITVDTTARWKISNVLEFIRTVRVEDEAMERIGTILSAETRDTISNYNLVEAVRNSNDILDRIKELGDERKQAMDKALKDGTILDVVEEEVTGEIENVKVGREHLSSLITDKAKPLLRSLGIELIDVQLRRIAYHKSVEAKVYQRMISERKRIAAKIRSVGKGEQAKIEGKTSLDQQEIESEAYRTVQQVLGKAESQRARIYAETYNKDPEFYNFYRTLAAYEQGLRSDTKLLMSADSDFFKLLRKE